MWKSIEEVEFGEDEIEHICIMPGCYDVGDPTCYPDESEPFIYLCMIHAIEQGFCWCCGVRLGEDSHDGLCADCYVPGIDTAPFDNTPDLFQEDDIVILKDHERA